MAQEYVFTGENISQFAKLSIKPVLSQESSNKKKVTGIESINTKLLKLDESLKQRIISIRSIVTSKEAGAIIGKGGKNVKEVREIANVKAGVSKVVENVNERILTVTGTLEHIAKAYSLFAGYLIENNNLTNVNRYHNGSKVQSDRIPIHLLVSHLLLGSIFGKNGENIKEIQELSSAYIVVSQEMLPQSTERVIEIIGNVDSIHIAVYHIIVSILKDIERSTNAILYQPSVKDKEKIKEFLNISASHANQNRTNSNNTNNTNNNNNKNNNNEKRNMTSKSNNNNNNNNNSNNNNNGGSKDNTKKDTVEVHFKVPSHLVGCTIGKKGATIAEIRQVSGSKISISPITTDNKTERTFTLVGTEKSNEKALSMILQLLKVEAEKAKKEQSKQQGNNQDDQEDQEDDDQNQIEKEVDKE